MRRSIFFKNFAVTVCMFLVCSVILGVSMFFVGRAFVVQERRDGLQATVHEVGRYAEAVRKQGGLYSWDLRMNMTAIAQSTGNNIFVCDSTGMVISSSDAAWISPYFGQMVDAYVIEYIRTNGVYEHVGQLPGIFEGKHYILGEPVQEHNGRVRGYVFAAYDLTGVLQTWTTFIAIYAIIAAVVLAVGIVFSYVNSRKVSRPLYEVSAAARRFAQGDYSARVVSQGRTDEVGTLIEAFNGMADGLERNESLRREFVANISHELRTPMTTISGFADGILDGTIPPEKERQYLEAISQETKRLSRLVRSMLDMSRLRSGDPEKMNCVFDIGETVVRTILHFEERVNRKGLDIALEMPEKAIGVKGDIDAVTRVVYNLMDNAVKFSDPGGTVAVSMWEEGGKAFTSIRNQGVQIAEEELPLIFDRFHKSDRSRSEDRDGVGLGLYMVREILAAHGQDIFVTSRDGVTVFTFTLELAEEKMQKT